MKFNSEIVKKAWAIFKTICPAGANKLVRRHYLSEAYKSSIKFFKGLLNGFISFFKLPKKESDLVEITTRQILPLSYEAKGTGKPMAGNRFICLDAEKNSVISFYNFQLI
jgi:hypothetical protein